MAITSLVATTELEAVNGMLSAIGEAPISDVDAATQADVEMAVNILRDTCREIQSLGWKFNTEHALAVAPSVSGFSWTDPDASTLAIDIFRPPTGLISFTISPLASQISAAVGGLLDVSLRPSKQYTTGSPAAAVLVFYDRARNRDGFPATENRDFLYIDPVWLFDYAMLPESARRLIILVATRRFIESTLGEANLVNFKFPDQQDALRALVREQGIRDTASLLDHPDSARIFGGRPRTTALYTGRLTRPL